MKKRIAYLLIIIFLVGCSKKNTVKDQDVIRFNRYDGLNSLDPAFAKTQTNLWLTNQIFNGLVSLDDSLKVVPDLAQRWEISPDGTTYTFFITDKAQWHENACFGDKKTRYLNAYDVEYSFKRLISKELASPGSWVLANVASMQTLSDSVFQLKLKDPFPPFLELLANEYCSIVPKEAIEKYGATFSENPVGTGPYMFKLWEKNLKLVLRKNPTYFEKDENGVQLPYTEAIAVTFLPDKQSEFLQLIQGNIDFITGLDPSYKDELLTMEGELNPKYNEMLQLQKNPYLNTEYLCFYLDNDKKLDLSLRKAINYGFDRAKIIKYLRNNIGTPATGGVIPKGLSSYYSKGYDYNPQKAKELIDTYKKEKGNLPTVTLITNSDYVNICQYIQSEMNKLGFSMNVEVTQSSTIKQAKALGKLDFFRASWIADYPDGENYLALFYGPNAAPKGSNYTHFSNKTYDAWYEKSLKIVNKQERDRVYQQMDSLLLSEAPIVPLYYDESTYFLRKNVRNFYLNAVGTLNLKRVKKE